MSIVIKCDRCGETFEIEYTDTENLTKAPLPQGWNILDGSHVCPACDAKFQAFMRRGAAE
jgi:rubredoxin